MQRKLFGQLVRSLRKEHRDEHGTQWTQQALALKSGVDKRMIERIEQGQMRKIDSDIVLKLADALELTTMERKEFFFAAMFLDNRHIASPKGDPQEKLEILLHALRSIRLPAMIVDAYADVIAINNGALQLFDLHDDLLKYPAEEPAAYNMMRIIFARDSKYRQVLNQQWTRNALHNIRVFRGLTLRHRFHPYFKQVLSALWKHPTFRLYWEQAHLQDDEDSSTDSLIYEYTHPQLGPIRYIANASNSLTRSGDLHWAIYIPLDERTTDVFREMIDKHGTDVVPLAPWPKE
jgi:transcriptional regulator with XRE-family HTH domain